MNGLLCFFLATADLSLVFEADEAVYNGMEIELSGHVLLDHDVGSLTACEAVLKNELNQLDLYDHVTFDLKEGGRLNCAEAHLDQKSHSGEFLGDPFVVYLERSREGLPLILKSHTMSIAFNPQEEESLKNHINSVVAKKSVTVDYNHDFIAAADYATFNREQNRILMHAEGEEGHCHVTNRNGDLIHARQIFVDTLERRIRFSHPKGALYSDKQRLDFSSDTLCWDEASGTLVLRGHVLLSEGMGQFATDDELTLLHSLSNGKKQLKTIESTGHSVLTHVDEGTGHTLQCWGKMEVDHPNAHVAMEGQVSYEDDLGSLFADRVEVAYHWVEGRVVPAHILLMGRVKMINQKQQYALADRVEIFPATQEATLTGERVLIYDPTNDMQASGAGFKVKRDSLTKKEAITGIGPVRFNLLESEFEELYQRFEQLKGIK